MSAALGAVLAAWLATGVAAAWAAGPAAPADLEQLKHDALDLDADLRRLEGELLYPGQARLAVVLALESRGFSPQSLTLAIDGAAVDSHSYTQAQLEALRRGGIQPLYSGPLADGTHRVEAVCNGLTADRHPVSASATFTLTGDDGDRTVQLTLVDSATAERPALAISAW